MIHENAGKLPKETDLVNVDALIHAYFNEKPDANLPEQAVSFGTSGHRGAALNLSFNENHILAITQAICDYRKKQGIDGPVFMGFDTHALSKPAFESALEVLAANSVHMIIADRDEFTPTPVLSHAIIQYNLNRASGLSDGIVITPSHNPPSDGGFKYNPPNGGPADKEVTDWIQNRANDFLKKKLDGVKRIPFDRALQASTTEHHDFITPYVKDLNSVLDFEIIRASGLKLAVDPLGGAGVNFWQPIADRYKINLTVLNTKVDPTFKFMTCDWDGKIRMDPSSPYAMQSLLQKSSAYDLAFACDTDHDRHGIITKSGLMPANHYLAVMIEYLVQNRPDWSPDLKIGKTVVSSSIINRVANSVQREVFEVPVGFKWFVEGLIREELGFVGEESAGASFARKNGKLWTTDKDGLTAALLSAEITARTGKNPSERYADIATRLGQSSYRRIDEKADAKKRDRIKKITGGNVESKTLAGDPITRILTDAPGNSSPIGGMKVESKDAWFATRPSGTEDIYKIYAESFKGDAHLEQVLKEAKEIVDSATR